MEDSVASWVFTSGETSKLMARLRFPGGDIIVEVVLQVVPAAELDSEELGREESEAILAGGIRPGPDAVSI